MKQSRDLEIKHGQVIGDYVIKGSLPKTHSGKYILYLPHRRAHRTHNIYQNCKVFSCVVIGLALFYVELCGAHPDMSEEALKRLENFLENDPMARIIHHLKMKNLRLVDLFNQFDKDKSYTITIEEFKKGVKVTPVLLT